MSVRKTFFLASLLLLTTLPALQAEIKQSTRTLVPMGTGKLEPPSQATGAAESRSAQGLEIKREMQLEKPVFRGLAALRQLPTPAAKGKPVVGPGAGDTGFNGLDHFDQRNADHGNQFSTEPPDQALGVNGAQVFEAVNDALAVYDRNGNILAGPTSTDKFFGQNSEFVRPNGPFGPFVSDPRIIFDSDTQRWFVTVLEIDTNPTTGAFLTKSHIFLAVSQTADATGLFFLFSIDVTDTGFGACPCLGDQPLLGANEDGIFISTNQFAFSNSSFQTALILATDKRRLALNTLGPVVGFQGLTQAEGPGFSVHPAFGENTAASGLNGGTEYFLSSLDFTATADDRITVWALTNTSSLRGSTPTLSLNNVVIQTEIYGQPPNAPQKSGPTPLGTSLGAALELLASNDDRMNEVYFSQGKLFGAVNTIIVGATAPRVGIAWFEIKPSSTILPLTAHVVHQGYVAVDNENVLFPSIAINSKGQGVMGFTLSGPDFFPSFAYILLSTGGAGAKIHLVAPGSAPEDGFSGYATFGGNGVARWGDYGFAAVAPDGDVWIGGEYSPNRPRTSLANWGTWIEQVER
jgi:hypothetical protein